MSYADIAHIEGGSQTKTPKSAKQTEAAKQMEPTGAAEPMEQSSTPRNKQLHESV